MEVTLPRLLLPSLPFGKVQLFPILPNGSSRVASLPCKLPSVWSCRSQAVGLTDAESQLIAEVLETNLLAEGTKHCCPPLCDYCYPFSPQLLPFWSRMKAAEMPPEDCWKPRGLGKTFLPKVSPRAATLLGFRVKKC